MLQEVGMEGLLDLGMLLLWRYPNADPGSVGIRKVQDRRRMQVLRGQVSHKILWEKFVEGYRRCALVARNSFLVGMGRVF
jgi:hypothetical protein